MRLLGARKATLLLLLAGQVHGGVNECTSDADCQYIGCSDVSGCDGICPAYCLPVGDLHPIIWTGSIKNGCAYRVDPVFMEGQPSNGMPARYISCPNPPCAPGTYRDIWVHASGQEINECKACPPHSSVPEHASALERSRSYRCVCDADHFECNTDSNHFECKADSNHFECKACPLHSSSAPGSVVVRGCQCSAGHTGADGGPCVACSDCTKVVTFTATLNTTLAAFTTAKRDAYVAGMAQALELPPSFVAIASAEQLSRRRLLAASVAVETTVTVPEAKSAWVATAGPAREQAVAAYLVVLNILLASSGMFVESISAITVGDFVAPSEDSGASTGVITGALVLWSFGF